jgi:cob(I)alamin adenosyltransferase
LEQQNDKLSDIENAIMDCSEDLANLEKDGTVSIDKEKLNTLKLQINTLRTSKDVVQKQIEQQTIEALNKLDQSVAQNEGTEQEQEK